MENKKLNQRSEIECRRAKVANRWYWRWLPDRSWQSFIFVGLGTAVLILIVSWSAGFKSDMNLRAALVAAIWLSFAALAYVKKRKLGQLSNRKGKDHEIV
jgi:hypothetical protein